MTNEDNYDMILKLVLIGDSFVGKTNIMSKYLKNEFHEDSKATVGVEFGSKKFEIEGVSIKAQIWDTAGQERYKSITNAYYKGSKGAFIVYDISRKTTFENVDKWIGELKDNASEDVHIMIVGNKSDLEDKREVKKEEGIEFSKIYNYCLFFETSAKNNISIKELFEQVFEQLYLHYKKNMITDEEDESRENFHKRKETIILNKKNHNKKKRNNKNHCCNIY